VGEVEGSQDLPHISVKNNNGISEYYIGWTDFRDVWNPDIYGQKIIDGEIQWSEEGVQITNRDNQDELCEVVENYFIWQGWERTQLNIYVQLVDENGDPAPGWSEEGLEVCGNIERQRNPQGLLVPEGLLIIWEDYRSGDDDIYGQIVTEDGNILWQEDGVPLAAYDNDQSNPVFVYDDSSIYLVWEDLRNSDSYDIYLQKFDLNGNAIWEPELAVATGESSQVHPDLIRVGDKSILFWSESAWDYETFNLFDIKAQLVSVEGEFLWEDNGITICDARYDQQYPLAVSNDENDVYCIWSDERAYIYPPFTEMNIYAQKLYIDDSEIQENELIDQTVMSLTSFPNPFSSSTTISFSFAENGEDAEIFVYNLKGQKVKTLECINSFDAQATDTLSHIAWNGKDANGKAVSSGIYFYKLKSGKESITKKMLLLR